MRRFNKLLILFFSVILFSLLFLANIRPAFASNCDDFNGRCLLQTHAGIYCSMDEIDLGAIPPCKERSEICCAPKDLGEDSGGIAFEPETCEYILVQRVCVPIISWCVPGMTYEIKYPGIQTTVGCIPTEPKYFVLWLLKTAISIAAGIAFLLMIWGIFLIITSAGNPEKVKQGKEIFTAAIAGLLFIIFSIFLIELIGVKILQIPGFGT